MKRLVILRPEPGASATAETARRLGLNPLVIPLFAIEPVAWEPPDPKGFDALLLTSANALRYGGGGLCRFRSLPAYCVGRSTAQAAADAGFLIAGVGEGGVNDLLAGTPDDLRLLHLCGAERRPPGRPGQQIAAVPVYRAVELSPPPEFARIENSVVALHSPRAARRFSELADDWSLAKDTIAIAAISLVAGEAAGTGWQAKEAAPKPDDDALLALASRLCNNCR